MLPSASMYLAVERHSSLTSDSQMTPLTTIVTSTIYVIVTLDVLVAPLFMTLVNVAVF